MVYVAVEDIGPYKKGQQVPDAQASVWIGMYKFPPVKLLAEGEELPKEELGTPEEEPKAEEPKSEEPKLDAKAASEDFEKELGSIKGIGVNTVSDILKVFPAKELLVSAIEKGNDLPFRNDVAEALKKKFGKSE